jgi:hypothetical protein
MLRNTFNALLGSSRVVAVMTGGVLLSAGVIGCANADQSCASCSTTTKPAMMAHEMMSHTSGPFHGPKANTGTVMHRTVNGKQTLTVSDDFVIPDTPAPIWQVVDSSGNVYNLQQFKIKDNKTNRSITLPSYIRDVAKVRVWCAFAETLLGEASFDVPVK